MTLKNISILKVCYYSLLILLLNISRNILFSQSSRSNYMQGTVTIEIPKKTIPAKSFLSIYKKGIGTLEADLTIGGDDEDENYIFSQPVKICVDSKGNIFVLDFQENCIKKYNALGKYEKTISKAGKGPGEILNPLQMALDPNDNIVTWDFGNMRFSFFSNDDEFLKSINTTELIRMPEMIRDFEIGPNGNIYIETRTADFRGEAGGTLIKILQFSQNLKQKKIITSARINDNICITKPIFRNVPVPFCPHLFWGIAPSGNIIIANSKNYTLEIFSPEIKRLHKVQHKGTQIQVTNEDKEKYFTGIISGRAGSSAKRGASDFIRKATKFPKYKPYFRYLVIDHEGYILLPTYEMENENYIYEVFTPDGKFVNKLKLSSFGFSIIAKGFLYELKTSEDKFPSVIRYRLK